MSDDATEELLTARKTPPSSPVSLRAGDLRVLFVDGDLRYLEVAGTEVVRRVYVAVRDLDWNTLPGEISNLEIKDQARSFEVSFTRRHRFGAVDYSWVGKLTGDETGSISYEMTGEALASFPYAKIGICVHHPIRGFAGGPYSGTSQTGRVSGYLPDTIGPQVHLDDGTDLPLFDPVSDLELGHVGGGTVSFKFAGDLWEMEDQRNWTDQSFKTASTPASLGYRHQAAARRSFYQSVTIGAVEFPPALPRSSGSVRLGDESTTFVPRIGVLCAEPTEAVSPKARDLFALVSPAHLRCNLDAAGDVSDQIAIFAERAIEFGAQLELAVFVPDGARRLLLLSAMREALSKIRPLIARLLLFSEGKEATSPELAAQAIEVLRPQSEIPVVVGSDANFNELNRNRPGSSPASGLVWSANPQVHASDELSLVENLEAQAETVETARSFASGRAVHLSPITLRPRFNAVASTGEEFRPGGLPWDIDARQASLFAAAWTLGSVAVLSTSGVDTLTYYETIGPRGLIQSSSGISYPGLPPVPDTVYPVALALAELCSLQGARVLNVSGVDALSMAALACTTSSGRTLLVSNLTRREVTVEVVGLAETCRMRVLDAATVNDATASPREFLRSGDIQTATAGIVRFDLGPYAYARLDASS